MLDIRKYYLLEFFSTLHLFGAVMVPVFLNWGNISQSQILFLQSWFMVWIFILEVPTGVIADVFGRKYSLALGSLIIACGALLYGLVPHITIFLIGEFLFAMGISLWSGADKALLYDLIVELGLKHKKDKIFGNSQAFRYVGLLVAAPIGSYLAYRVALNAPMLLTSVPLFVSFFIALSIHEPKRYSKETEQKRYLDVLKGGLLYVRQNTRVFKISLNAVLVSLSAYFVIWLYQNVLIDLSVPLKYFGWMNALLIFSELFISTQYGFLQKIFRSKLMYLNLSVVFVVFGFLTIALFPSVYSVLIFLLFAGGFGLTRFEFVSFYLNDFIPQEQRATILSFISMMRRFVLIFANPIVGIAIEKSVQGSLFIIGLIPLVVFIFPLKEQKNKE